MGVLRITFTEEEIVDLIAALQTANNTYLNLHGSAASNVERKLAARAGGKIRNQLELIQKKIGHERG